VLVGVLADSHDNLPKLRAALDLLSARGARHLLHAGDYVAPFAVKVLLGCGVPFTGVFGNNDGERAGIAKLTADIHPAPHRFELGGRRFVLVHDLDRLAPDERRDADVVVCGHTHRPEIAQGPPLVLNPGECCGWVEGRCTVALLDTESLGASILDV